MRFQKIRPVGRIISYGRTDRHNDIIVAFRSFAKHLNTRQAMWVYNCCSGQAVSNTYSERVSEPLVFQHAMRMRYIVISTVFVYILINGVIFEKKSYSA
jgi:hypothetical protein